ncbi:MAG: energy transducer TonB [Kofleriaceae bacterium]|nr:energy transducer TonB [Kofleriaceae bacterium]MBP6835645.1 energy transducer TonB [Kofleriaceae bacterium]
MRCSLALVAVVIGVGCDGEGGQTFRQGVEAICTAEQTSNATEVAPADRDRVISAWVAQHVRNQEALAVFGSLAGRPTTEHAAILAAAAKKAGLTTCPLAERRVDDPVVRQADPTPPTTPPPAPPAPGPRAPGSVEVTTITASSTTATRAIQDKLQSAYRSALTRCYRSALSRQPGLGGTVTVRFTVSPTGRTAESTVEAPDPALGQCVEQSARSWRFDSLIAAEDQPALQVELVLTLVP